MKRLHLVYGSATRLLDYMLEIIGAYIKSQAAFTCFKLTIET